VTLERVGENLDLGFRPIQAQPQALAAGADPVSLAWAEPAAVNLYAEVDAYVSLQAGQLALR
ncbi:hypothetical protein, partial [Halomonas campaniensis]